MAKSPSTRVCIFCGGASQTLTKEHVFPDWLSELYGKADGRSEIVGKEEVRTWPQKAFQQTVRVVCGKCNNGWLSTLENEVKPYLGNMIRHGTATVLDEKKQTALAVWATKTLMVSQYAYQGDVRLIPATDYKRLYETKAPLPNYAVFIAFRQTVPNLSIPVASQNFEQIGQIQVPKEMADDLKKSIDSGEQLYGGSLVVGQVAFHVIGNSFSNAVINVPPLGNFELPLYPYSHDFHWPATFPIELMGGLDGYLKALQPPTS